MSEYDSSSQGSQPNQDNQQYFKVFQHDFYLSGSLPNIEQWKANMLAASINVQQQQQLSQQQISIKREQVTNKGVNELNILTYLEKQQTIFDREQNYLLAAYHIRFYSFANYLKLGFEQLVKQYQQLFITSSQDNNIENNHITIIRKLHELDTLTTKLTMYLQKLQLSRAQSYVNEIDSELIPAIYMLLEQLFPFVTNKYCIWRIVMFLEIMNQQTSSYIMNTPFNMNVEYYLKTFKTLKSKHDQLTKIALMVNTQLEKQMYLEAYVKAVREILLFNQKPKEESEKLQLSLMCEFITCLKYMHLAVKDITNNTNNNNKQLQEQNRKQDLCQQYINASLKVPYYRKNDNMPTQYYQQLFLRILTQVKQQPQLTDLALYIDPNVAGQRSKESFGKLQQLVLNLCKELTEAQQEFLQLKKQPQPQYLKKLLKNQQFTLLIQFLQTIMQFNKSAFLKADTEIYQTFLDMAEYLKSAFLSFGKDLWLFPQNIFTPLTLGFFKKIAQDINDDLNNILYQMVENLNADRLPEKLVCENGQFVIKKVTRLEYLSAIMYYIEDCSREEEYLNLPEIAPANLQTSILLIKSLHVKLKHHQPNPAQLPLFTQYLKECEKYKLNIKFGWYKNESYISKSFQRETQFQIQSGLLIKDIQKQFRKCLNHRDRQFARVLIEEDYNNKHLMASVDVAALLKYNHGMEILPEIQNIPQGEIFLLLQQMQTMLAILPNEGLFELPLQEQVIVNYLHLLLTFYCSKIKSAKGSQIYLMILQKILINYLKSPFNKSQQFKKKYPKFFQRFIYQFHQIQICSTLNDMLMQFQQQHQQCLPKDEQKWTSQQKNTITDLKQKIQIIRQQFLDKLQGEQQQIAMWIVTFTSLISQQMPFVIFLQCLRLFVKLITKKPSLSEIVSISVFLSDQKYHQQNFFNKMLSYIEDYQSQDTGEKMSVKCYIVKHLLKSPEILSTISFVEMMQLLDQALKLFVNKSSNNNQNNKQQTIFDENIGQLFKAMKDIVENKTENVRPQWILPYILLFTLRQMQEQQTGLDGMFDQQPQKKKRQSSIKYEGLLNSLKKISEVNKQFWAQMRSQLDDFKISKFKFIQSFTEQLKTISKSQKIQQQSNKQQKQPKQQQNQPLVTFKTIWLHFLTQLRNPQWTFYYMVKLSDPLLINIHQNRDQMLIYLIKKEKLTKQSYPIFKHIINQTKNMTIILDNIMQSYQEQQNYVQNYQFHNKLILINQRYPNSKIQQVILKWIEIGQNKLPLKIPQHYYIQFLKKRLRLLPQSVGVESILKVNKGVDQLPKLTKQIERVFQLLLYFPFHKFKSYQLSKKNEVKEEKGVIKKEGNNNKIQQKQQQEQKQQKQQQTQQQKPQPIEDDQQQQGDWQQQDEDNGELQIKKTSSSSANNKNDNKNDKKKRQQQPSIHSSSQSSQNQHQQPGNNNNEQQSQLSQQHSNDDDQNYDQSQRPKILQIFYEQNSKLQLNSYKRYCQLRQHLDVYVKSEYVKLSTSPISDNQFLVDNLLAIIKQLQHLPDLMQQTIITHMPQQLYHALNKLGYKKQRDMQKITQLRKPQKKIFHLQAQLFSDRGESDISEDGNGNEDQQDGEGYADQYYDDQDGGQGWANQDDGDSIDQQQDDQDDSLQQQSSHKNHNPQLDQQAQSSVIVVKKPFTNKKPKKQPQKQQQDDIQLPQLSAQFSKVQSQIKGSQLQRKQLIKILQIFLVQLFKLTPINFKKKQIVYSYVEIMESDLSQIFFQSVLTLLRLDENPQKNRKLRLQQMKAQLLKTNSPFSLQQLTGFQQFSKYNGLVNFIHLLKALKQKGKYIDDETNPFKKQSGILLPIAERFIIEFDLPIQTNVFSLVLLYIHSKPKVRDMIHDIAVSNDQDGIKLTKKQIKRLSAAFFAQKVHNSAWQFIQSTVNYKVYDIDRLIISLDTYSQQVLTSLAQSAFRVKQTIQKSNESYSSAKILSQKQMKPSNLTHIKHYQRLYYITSNLLTSCSQQIKQFYYMNKQICRYLWQDDEENSQNYNYSKVPKKLLKAKDQIYTNQSFVTLLELAFRVIYFVKKQLYGKVSPKKFARIIHYPKMIIETATLYMHLTGEKGKKTDWKFISKKDVQAIIDNTKMGGYKFKSLIQVYNLILGLLEIQSFSAGKFKQLLIPYFTENKHIGLQAPLMFKVPEISDDNINGQQIFVTRECSFDMAFYQVNGQGLFVQFHGQEGSDHGGMIRQLMMGWKGVGIGQQDFFIGKILGISFRQSVPYGGYIDLQMCIKITNYEITMQNLQQLDKQIYSSLKYIMQNDPQNLGLTFSIMKKNPKNFQVEEYDLIENGRKIDVVQSNKKQYINLYMKKYYELGRQLQLQQIATGFYTVVPKSYAQIFKPHELMQHLKGQQVCDINVLKSHVKYMQGYTQTSVIIKWLWEILQSYNQQQLNKFIQFLTGSPKLPIFNPNFQITIQKVYDVKNLPVAHTCFNTLDLPQYPTKDILERNMLTAIFEGNDNFGIM